MSVKKYAKHIYAEINNKNATYIDRINILLAFSFNSFWMSIGID